LRTTCLMLLVASWFLVTVTKMKNSCSIPSATTNTWIQTMQKSATTQCSRFTQAVLRAIWQGASPYLQPPVLSTMCRW
jgi:hypothetical protein